MKWVLIVMLSTGQPFVWEEFNSEIDARSYKNQLFYYTRKYNKFLVKRGFDIPIDWVGYDSTVVVKPKVK